MIGGRLRVFRGIPRKGKEVEDGVGEALKAAFHPMQPDSEHEADEAMKRCIEALNNVEGVLRGKLKDGSQG